MKKRILLLVPCLLLVLGLLTACGSNGGGQSDDAAEQQLFNTTWQSKVDENTKLGGLINIDSSFWGDILTIKFDDDHTGYIGIFEDSKFHIDFNWKVNKNQIVLTFNKAGFIPIHINFRLANGRLILEGNNFNIDLKLK